MKFLVDSNVLSEPTKPRPDRSVIEWIERNEQDVAVDPIVLGEIRFGILRLPPGKRRAELQDWFHRVVETIHCVPWDAALALRWAELLNDLRASGKAMPVKDSLIAASALANQMVVVTRNQTDFENADVEIVNPFTSSGLVN